MKALAWHGKGDIRCDTVPDPKILDGRDAIIKVTACAICGSDLHLLDGVMPSMQSGDVVGHEAMGEVVEVGRDNKKLKVGDRVVVPFTISCGECFFCTRGYFSGCERTNPNGKLASELWGHSPAGLFGYSHLLGGYPGGQAEYLRVPYADVGPIKVPDGLTDEQVLFLSDIFPTGYMGAEFCDIRGGETIAVFGCGPVAQFSIRSAFLLGAHRVVVIDRFDYRLDLVRRNTRAETLNYERDDVRDSLKEMTAGRGPDAVIDAVGLEAHGLFVDNVVDQVKASLFLGTDRPHSIRQAIIACRKGGRVSMPAVYGGFVDKFPLGAFMEKGLTLKTGQTHVQHYMPALLNAIMEDKIDTEFLISHRLPLEDAVSGYKNFKDNQNEWTKVVLKPGMA